MYISNITHVNITNYLKISFQSVSGSLLVQQQQQQQKQPGTSLNQLQQVKHWSVGAGWKQSEPKTNKQTKNSQNESESGGTS